MAIFGLGNVVGALIVLRTKPSRPLFAGAIAVATVALSPLVVALGLSAPAIAAAAGVAVSAALMSLPAIRALRRRDA